jgi:hypothetical protein
MNLLKPLLLASILVPGLASFGHAQADQTFDVVVIGGSSGGVGAALGAARLGVRVALVEDTPVLGGMLANGISNIDTFSYESLSGVFEEFRRAVIAHYRPQMETDPIFRMPAREPYHMDGRSMQANEPSKGGRWEPHVADRIFKNMVAQYKNLTVFYNRFATGVLKKGNRVVGVTTDTDKGQPLVLHATVVVDATHEADIATWAGVPYRVGREPRSPLEPHAGQVFFFNETGEFLPGTNGQQDRAVVSYGVRLCIKNYKPEDGDAHVLRQPPPDYDKAQFKYGAYSGRPSMPGDKSEMNSNPVGNEMQEVNWDWPEATRQQRQQMYQQYKNHALGFLYYVQHECGKRHLGLPRDEFTDNDNVPYRVFVREARRIEGVVTMTEADINPFILGRSLAPPLRRTSVAVGHYPIDAKPVRNKTDIAMPDKGDGDFFLVNVASPFQVPFEAILPRNVDGILVPVALSATHVAFSAVRMDPTWTVLGQAAGAAAAMCCQRKIQPRQLPIDDLQRELVRQKIKLAFYWDVSADHAAFDAIQLLSVRGVVEGDPERCFHPDEPLTRAAAAVMLYRALELWPSVSNAHFEDVPYTHPAFREIETLFDRGGLVVWGVEPRWPAVGRYIAGKHSGFNQKRQFSPLQPDTPVTARQFDDLIRILQSRTATSPGRIADQAPAPTTDNKPSPVLTRAQACQALLNVLYKHP